MRPRRIFVEAWDPEYGSTLSAFPSDELAASLADVDPGVEVPLEDWAPIGAATDTASSSAESLLFVDGVRRIDAVVWIETQEGGVRPGLCASCAAGTVRAGRRAEIVDVEVRRGLFTGVDAIEALETDVGVYAPVAVRGETTARMSAGVQEELRRLEAEVAASATGAGSDFDLLVVDGPLSAHHSLARTVGYVKSHRVAYLDRSLEPVIHRLEPYERTPLFLTTVSWKRFSCYLRLEGEKTHPWAGVVRLEIPGDRSLEEARRLVNVASRALPRFSSVPYKDPRAPQNLFPIGGLERELRRRLGDHALVHRALLAAAAGTL